jgi:hypothetical protein
VTQLQKVKWSRLPLTPLNRGVNEQCLPALQKLSCARHTGASPGIPLRLPLARPEAIEINLPLLG